MPFYRDEEYAAEVGRAYGEYLVTYKGPADQVRAYIFQKLDGRVEAHVAFRRGYSASNVSDPYVTDLWTYAKQAGFENRFHLIMS